MINYLIISTILILQMNTLSLFDFKTNSNINNWRIVNDGVMGGLSSSKFEIDEKGNGVFKGNVSLENNGGFASVKYNFPRTNINQFNTIVLKIKADSKRYQLRLKANQKDYFSYIKYFTTNGEWQEIEIKLSDMYPTFRGRKLDQPNFNEGHIEEISFLIGNKKEESFKLLIDEISVK